MRYVDFERRLILVRETVVNGEPDTTKTYDSARDIEVSQAVCDALTAQRAATAHLSEYVFCNRDGKPLDHNNFTTRVWYRCCGISICAHAGPTSRVTPPRPFGCQAARVPNGLPGKLGHTTTEMLFRVYSRFRPNLTRQDGAAFERLLNSILPGIAP